MEYKTTRVIVRPDIQAELDALIADPEAMARVTATFRLSMLIMQARLYGYSEPLAREWARSQLTDAERTLLAHEVELPDRPQLESDTGHG